MTPANPIEVAVVGVGYWGPNLLRVLNENPGWKVTLCCDLDGQKLERMHRRFPNVPITDRLEEVWKSSAQAVVIATPVRTHADLVMQAISAGKHVLIEKPLAASVPQAEDVVAAARRAGIILMVGHTFLFSPPVLKVKKIIEEGKLGKIYYISSSRVNLGLYRKDINVLWDLGPHDLSILLFWLGESPARVAARGRCCLHESLQDIVFLNLEFPSGVVAMIELSWLAPHKLRRTVIVGSGQMLVYDDTDPNEKIKVYDRGVLYKQPDSFGEFQLTYRTGDVVSPQLDNYEPLSAEAEQFLESVRDNRTPRSDGEFGLEIVRVLQAAAESLTKGGATVELPIQRT